MCEPVPAVGAIACNQWSPARPDEPHVTPV